MERDGITRFETGRPAFLIVQRGAARLEVVQLELGAPMTVGRASTNRIVIPDAKCSREHCEVFSRDGRWYLRDKDSRNGVSVNDNIVDNDWPLEYGQTISVGNCTMLFSDQSGEAAPPRPGESEPYAIIERKSGTRYDAPSGTQRATQGQHEVAELFQLAREMNVAPDLKGLGNCVLERLLKSTTAKIGAVLVGIDVGPVSGAEQLVPIAIQSLTGKTPERFSEYLSDIVISDGEALLAHDISQHSSLASRDSLNAHSIESAVCAPIRHEGKVWGLIHLYTHDSSQPLEALHLEFALAVADQMAGPLISVREREQLAAGKSKAEIQFKELQSQLGFESELVGQSQSLEKLRRSIARVAATDATVLIRGESGVGKELVARAVHFNSLRKTGPFVCVNCAALSESLLESELFGHEKGAFTGAAGQRLGKFEQADEGTLFLDEIGEMSPDIQSKFLRVLEGQAFERVGGGKPIEVDVRVVTATNRHLEEAVREGKFRQDLYFRLQVIELIVPPLREHPEDIPVLAQHFVERFARKSRPKVRGFNKEAIEVLKRHRWPGNVRELRNVVERAVILSEHELLTPEDVILTKLEVNPQHAAVPAVTEAIPVPVPQVSDSKETSIDPFVDLLGSFAQQRFSLDDVDRMYIEAALAHCLWNKSLASRLLGIERTTLDRRLKKYGLSRPGMEDEGGEDTRSD